MDTLSCPRCAAEDARAIVVRSLKDVTTARLLRYQEMQKRLKELQTEILNFEIPPKRGYVWVKKVENGISPVDFASQKQLEYNEVYEMSLDDFESNAGKTKGESNA